jgi:hypothetical protein
MPASVVIGQPDFISGTLNQGGSAAANTLRNPGQIIVVNNKLIVTDNDNNRVLIWNTLPTTNNTPADVVIGQTNFTNVTEDQGGSAAANTIDDPFGVATDGTKLFIGDADNNRVLIYNSIPTTNNASADVVIGQTTMAGQSTGTTNTTMDHPVGLAYDSTQGKLAVFDANNNRVLIYNTVPTSSGATADVVIGQTNFTSKQANQGGSAAANTLSLAFTAGVGTYNGKLFIGDRVNNRVLIFNQIPTSNNASADVVIGQTNFTSTSANQGGSIGPSGLNLAGGGQVDDQGRLFVYDRTNARVLIFNQIPTTNGASADIVIGEPDFATGTGGTTNKLLKANPFGVALYQNQLIVSDSGNHRILIFPNTTGTGGSVSTPSLSMDIPTTSLSGGRLRISGNAVIGDRGTSAIQYVQASVNGLGYGNVSSLSGGRDFGTTGTVYDWYHDFDPTVGDPALFSSTSNYTIKFVTSDFNADLNYLFYFLPLNLNIVTKDTLGKNYTFSFSVNKYQVQTIKNNISKFEVQYKTTSGSWTKFSDVSKDLISTSTGEIYTTIPTTLTNQSYDWRVVAYDNYGHSQYTNTINTTTKTTTVTYSGLQTTPTLTPEPTPEPTPFLESLPFLGPVIPSITNNLQNFFDQIGPELQKLFSSFTVFVAANQQIIQKAAPIVLLGLLPLTSVILVISNLTNTSLSWNFFVRSLQALGILPKGKPMGRVNDSVSNTGVSFAVLTLKGVGDGTYNTDTFVSDSSGIYHGAKFPVGQYKLIANHQDYNFPTNQQRPMYLTPKDFYRGEVFSITDSRSDHFLSVPMDSRTNTNTKLSLGRRISIIFRGILSVIEKISKILFWPFAILSITLFVISPSVVNGIMAAIYVVVILFKLTKKLISLFPTTLSGVVVDENSKPIEGVLVKLLTKDGQTTEVTRTNQNGRYKLYSPKQKYQMTITKDGYQIPEEIFGGYIEAKGGKTILRRY